MKNLSRRLRVLFHPIAVFVIAQVSWGLLMFVWIRWYVLRGRELELSMKGMPLPEGMQAGSGFILAQGCVLMGFILIAFYLIFLAFRKQVSLNRMQQGILDSVTHELKTPLAAIRLHTETMLMRKLPEEARLRFLQRNMVEIERLQRLIDGVLVSARLEGGNLGSERENLDVVELAEQCWGRFSERVGTQRELKFERPARMFRSYLNAQQMEILFDNLLDNAFKYTEPGGLVALDVLVGDGFLRATVRDSGCGLEKRDLKRVFRKFVRIENGRKRRVSGSGLGLFVCDSIVKAHGGRIWATSEGLGKGATFHVELPRIDRSR